MKLGKTTKCERESHKLTLTHPFPPSPSLSLFSFSLHSSQTHISKMQTLTLLAVVALTIAGGFNRAAALGGNTNSVYSPCSDTRIQRSDGFTFGIAFSSRASFFLNQTVLLSPCDRRLTLAAMNSQLSVFRPKIDEISLLSINTSSFFPVLLLLIGY